ncbi:MAG: hypothetical protein ABUL60_29720 [Myxococcales bacterium]
MSARGTSEAALDALAAALAPRVQKLLREHAAAEDDGLAVLFAAAGFEIDADGRGKGAA